MAQILSKEENQGDPGLFPERTSELRRLSGLLSRLSSLLQNLDAASSAHTGRSPILVLMASIPADLVEEEEDAVCARRTGLRAWVQKRREARSADCIFEARELLQLN